MRRNSSFKLNPPTLSSLENSRISQRTYLLLSLLILSGCSVVAAIPGMDRIINPDSSAEVGPLLTQVDDRPVLPPESNAQTSAASPAEMKQPPPVEPVQPPVAPAGDTPTAAAPTQVNEQALPVKKSAPETDQVKVAPKVATEATADKPEAEPPIAPPEPMGRLSGTVVLQGTEKLSPEGTLISLVPEKPLPPREHQAPATYEIDMEQKIYQPGVLAISSTDRVVFANKDKIRHNVFSSSGKNAFDLGTYGAGLKRSVMLKEPGIVKVYCNIHAEMATFIAVGEPGLTTAVSAQGKFTLDKLPPGKYRLHAWNIRGETWRDVEIRADQTQTLSVNIQVAEAKVESHTNKFGKTYTNNATQFEDEFY